jgi:hypothetical protein
MAQLVTFTIASRGCSIVGSGISSQRMSLGRCQHRAFMAFSLLVRGRVRDRGRGLSQWRASVALSVSIREFRADRSVPENLHGSARPFDGCHFLTCGYAWRGSFHRMLGFRISRGAIANTGRASPPELLQPQFIDQQRLNDDRAFSNEPRPKPCMANELSEQFQIGIRREEHI